MVIERIELNHFRNYDRLVLEPHEGINIFFGQNGSGKTNLLEAIHYCGLGKSHRITQDINAVQMGASGCSCRLSVKNRLSRNDLEIRLQPGDESVKSVWIDQKRAARLSEMMGVLRCVIFSPEDLDLIKDGPSVRRRFLDMMISQISRPYFIALQQYRTAMNQRSAILRKARLENTRIDPMIEDFEAAMCEQAKLICGERIKYTGELAQAGHTLYQQISGKESEDFLIQYRPSVREFQEDPSSLLHRLKESREEDLKNGTTSAGPHRDDLLLSLNQKSMKLYASQGQMRTGALSLKLAQMRIYQQTVQDQPVLLLDDVMSELDLERRMNLLRVMDGVQTFITCSDEGDLASWQNHRTYEVKNLKGSASIEIRKQGSEKPAVSWSEPIFE
ncbi:MAG: DNA replication/repair protein RecF [Clostridia bacterium]|nr:DNA replication/repair protein RecF [Clostridia bacterium]